MDCECLCRLALLSPKSGNVWNGTTPARAMAVAIAAHECLRDAAGQRALPGSRGPVDRYDRALRHAADRAAPAWFISATKPGKLVSMNPASSTVTGSWVAEPNTNADIAIR